jgi:hypothetical protein
MKNVLTKTSFLLYFLVLPVFFVLGTLFAFLTDAAKNQGLAGGAIVLMYGIMFAFVGLVIAIILTIYLTKEKIVKINRIFAVILLIIGMFILYRVLTRETPELKFDKPSRTPTKTAEPVIQSSIFSSAMFQSEKLHGKKMNIGFFKPNFYEQNVLYFYGNPNLDKSVMEHFPTDSVVFKKLEQGGFDVTYAPPWLVPEHLKLDYDILFFEAVSVGLDFIKVNANKLEMKEVYVSSSAGKIIYWPEFLLNVNSVEFIDGRNQKVFIKPFDHASTMNLEFDFMKPVFINTDWMMVYLVDSNYNTLGKGWIKWRENNELLISYSLLS